MINIGSTCTGGRVEAVTQDQAQITLTSPACTEIGEKIALSRRIDKHWRYYKILRKKKRRKKKEKQKKKINWMGRDYRRN